MKILVDQNISFRVVQRIVGFFPEVAHVKALSLMDANDHRIFMSARQQNFTAVITQDEDFYNLLLEHGSPLKLSGYVLATVPPHFWPKLFYATQS